MTILACAKRKSRVTEPLDRRPNQSAPPASLIDMLGTFSDDDLAELDRYLRVYRRSGIGSFAGFLSLT